MAAEHRLRGSTGWQCGSSRICGRSRKRCPGDRAAAPARFAPGRSVLDSVSTVLRFDGPGWPTHAIQGGKAFQPRIELLTAGRRRGAGL